VSARAEGAGLTALDAGTTALDAGTTGLAIRPSAVGTGRAFGTFGELIQGALGPDGRDFLVTLPIQRWSVARYQADPRVPLHVVPAGKTKSAALAGALLAKLGRPACGRLTVRSELPAGKGMASSSADLVATARAICGAFDIEPSPAAIEDMLRDIEPSDGVMYDEVVAFYHREVRLRQPLGGLPPLTIVGLDEGGTIDTIRFNAVPKLFSAAEMGDYEAMLHGLARAVEAADMRTLGALATRSAVMNQRLHPKRLLGDVTGICHEAGGLGVVAAHSGTKLGILLADDDPRYRTRLAAAVAACQRLSVPMSIERTLPRT
jgi:uncharacterized protein involved in propanediol utilization